MNSFGGLGGGGGDIEMEGVGRDGRKGKGGEARSGVDKSGVSRGEEWSGGGVDGRCGGQG